MHAGGKGKTTSFVSDMELCYLSAGEALSRFKARQLSPVELMQAVIARARPWYRTPALRPKL